MSQKRRRPRSLSDRSLPQIPSLQRLISCQVSLDLSLMPSKPGSAGVGLI